MQIVLEVDLKERLSDVTVDARYHKVLFLVRWGYTPLGMLHYQVPAYDRIIRWQILRSLIYDKLGWQIWQRRVTDTLDHISDRPDSALPPISVAVCTRDRPLSLENCLTALSQLDYPQYEVIVVDNASRDPSIRDIVEARGFRYVREDTPGLDWARNRAYREARHEIVAYIDDDATASAGWLRGIAEGFSDPAVMAVTGMVLPAELETAAQINFENYGGMNKGYTPWTVRREDLDKAGLLWSAGWGVGANMAYRRDLFERIGGFDPALDVGTATRGGGDIEFFHRTVAAGYSLRYEPAAYVYHVHRRHQQALMRQIADNGRSFPAYLLTVFRKHPDQRSFVVRFALRSWLWNWLLKRWIQAKFRRDPMTAGFAAAEIKGSLGALRGYREARRTVRKYEAGV